MNLLRCRRQLELPKSQPLRATVPKHFKNQLFLQNTKRIIFIKIARWDAPGASPGPLRRGLRVPNGFLGRTWACALDLKWKIEGPGGPSFPCCPQIWLGTLAFFPFKSTQYLPQNTTMDEDSFDL